MTILNKLIGSKVSKISGELCQLYPIGMKLQGKYEVSLVIHLGDYVLTIYNACKFLGSLPGDNFNEKLVSHILESVFETNERIVFNFDEDLQICVNLLDEDFFGPEAMTLHGPNNLIVVWN